VRLIGLLLLAVVAAIVLWLVFINPRRGGDRAAPVAGSPAVGRPAATPYPANSVVKTQMADEAARQAQAAAKAKAAKARAEALAAEAAQADELERNMTPAQNRLNEDYAAQVGDTRPAADDAGGNAAGPDSRRP
jgi:hypothetical protein